MRHQGRPEERSEEAGQADRRGFLPLGAEHGGVQLGARQEGQHDSAGARQEGDPLRLGIQDTAAHQRADNELRNRTDYDFGERRRDAQPVGRQNRKQRQR